MYTSTKFRGLRADASRCSTLAHQTPCFPKDVSPIGWRGRLGTSPIERVEWVASEAGPQALVGGHFGVLLDITRCPMKDRLSHVYMILKVSEGSPTGDALLDTLTQTTALTLHPLHCRHQNDASGWWHP